MKTTCLALFPQSFLHDHRFDLRPDANRELWELGKLRLDKSVQGFHLRLGNNMVKAEVFAGKKRLKAASLVELVGPAGLEPATNGFTFSNAFAKVRTISSPAWGVGR